MNLNLENFTSREQFESFINTNFPNWLLYSLNDYSEDYPHFKQNWITICKSLNVQPKNIILVNKIQFEDKNDPLIQICEFMTKKGYVVRRVDEFIPCSSCEKAIPCEEIYELLKERNFKVPSSWQNKCSSC